jgi:glycosyltransferase involved in cell wall biosynthesis
MNHQRPVRVVHLVDALGGSGRLWGKEAVVALLMREQRASGSIKPELVTFTPCRLGTLLAAEGFRVDVLAETHARGFGNSLPVLGARLRNEPPAVVHSHGYRANIVAKTLRLTGRARGIRLVSTCHGWVDDTIALRIYNTLDRYSTFLSDVTTVPDPRMLAALPPLGRHVHVPNAVPDLHASPGEPDVPRAGAFVAGTLGRLSVAKGILDLLAAARDLTDPDIAITLAGDGELLPQVRAAGHNVHYLGYFDHPQHYVASLDVYVQASHAEGLSLALLEAMRAGKAIIATGVGATCDAVVDGESALIVPAHDPAALRNALLLLRDDPALRGRLGNSARLRFEAEFQIGRQHQRYLDLYTREAPIGELAPAYSLRASS